MRKFKGASLSSVHLWCQRQCLMTILVVILRKRTHFIFLRRSNLSGSSKALHLSQNKVKTLTLAQKALGNPVPVLFSAFILDQTLHWSLHFECLDTFMHSHSIIGIYSVSFFFTYTSSVPCASVDYAFSPTFLLLTVFHRSLYLLPSRNTYLIPLSLQDYRDCLSFSSCLKSNV